MSDADARGPILSAEELVARYRLLFQRGAVQELRKAGAALLVHVEAQQRELTLLRNHCDGWSRDFASLALKLDAADKALAAGAALTAEVKHGANQTVVGGIDRTDNDALPSPVRSHEHEGLQQRPGSQEDGRSGLQDDGIVVEQGEVGRSREVSDVCAQSPSSEGNRLTELTERLAQADAARLDEQVKGERVFEAVVYAFEGRDEHVPDDLREHGMVRRALKFRAAQAERITHLGHKLDDFRCTLNTEHQFGRVTDKAMDALGEMLKRIDAALVASRSPAQEKCRCVPADPPIHIITVADCPLHGHLLRDPQPRRSPAQEKK